MVFSRQQPSGTRVFERFETACDDLDSGLFSLDQRHCYCCMIFFAGAIDRFSYEKSVQLPGAR
jgi:hypothetical protein